MKNKILFLGGLHRSGTTLLHKILCEHEEISGFKNTGVPEDEGQHLQTVYKSEKHFGGPGYFALHKECYMDEKHALVNNVSRERLLKQWGEYWNKDKTVWLEKSPPNIIRSRFLQSLFPEARFIFILRHPIATSLATQKWSQNSVIELMKHWAKAHKIMKEDLGHLNHAHIIYYEDLTATPQQTMQKIFDFLNLPFHNHMQEVVSNLNNDYFKKWHDYSKERPHEAAWVKQNAGLFNTLAYSVEEAFI